MTLQPGALVWRENEPGTWRVLQVQERRYARGDYIPIGAKLGDPAPHWCVLERFLDYEFRSPKATGRGHAPRRAGAPITSLKRIVKADLDALVQRIAGLASLLP